MPVSTDNKQILQRKQASQTLLGFLLGLLELETEPAKSLDRLLPLDSSRAILPGTLRDSADLLQADLSEDELDGLTGIGAYIGLRMERVVLTPSAAAEASAAQTPLVARLSGGRGWLVLYGFRGGRVRVAAGAGRDDRETSD